MAWSDVPRKYTADLIDASFLNTYLRDNLDVQSAHQHGGASGNGDDELDGVDQVDFDQIAAPGAPASGKTRVYVDSGDGYVYVHPNGGSAAQVSLATHSH